MEHSARNCFAFNKCRSFCLNFLRCCISEDNLSPPKGFLYELIILSVVIKRSNAPE